MKVPNTSQYIAFNFQYNDRYSNTVPPVEIPKLYIFCYRSIFTDYNEIKYIPHIYMCYNSCKVILVLRCFNSE